MTGMPMGLRGFCLRHLLGLAAATGLAFCLSAPGCVSPGAVFNPAFLDVVDGEGTEQLASIENAPGHVPIIFVNNLRYSSQMTSHLTALNVNRRLSGLESGISDVSNLVPRARLRMRVTFENGESLLFELVAGDAVVELEFREDEDQAGGPPQIIDPALSQNPLTRLVASCNVTSVALEGSAQVFVPVFVRTIRINFGEFGGRIRELINIDSPQFRPLLADEVDEDLNVTLQRNYSVREALAPATNTNCGQVIGIVLSGTINIPFTPPEDEPPPTDEFILERDQIPGVLDTDVAGQASIPGRVDFNVRIIG